MTAFVRNRAAFAAALAFALGLASQANASVNLITNGDFSAGNVGFASDYAYVPPPGSPATSPGSPPTMWNETTYAVGANANLYHALWYDVPAPSGAGNYLIVNGGTVTPLATVWTETATVAANASYTFSGDVASVYPANPATLTFYVNDVAVGSYTPSATAGAWGAFSFSWYSGSATSAVLSIVDTNTIAGGNDFGIDNLSFADPVPELSTWLMVGLGFAALGLTGSRVRRTARALA